MSFLKLGGLAFVALVLGFWFFGRGGHMSSSEARRMVEAGALLLDVRTQAEFGEAHIPGAINIPVQELAARLGELESKERPIVLYCRSGNRSGTAARLLQGAGYQQVHDLGAMSAW